MDEQIYLAKNPWKNGIVQGAPRLDRAIFDAFMADLGGPEILVLLGARQTGKTTLLLETARRCLANGAVLPEHLHYLDLDTMRCQDVLESNRSFIDFLGIEPDGTGSPRRLVLIDEIQRLENPGLFLKSVYDLHLPLKLAVTGSSTLEIQSRVRESLAGRSMRHYLWPLTPTECRGTDLESVERYIQLGGFPAVVVEEQEPRRHSILANLLASYVDRDIAGFMRVENVRGFRAFVQLLAGQTGQLVNLNEMSNSLGLSRDTLSRFLSYLENTFMVRVLRPFLGNRRGELTKMPKVYFADLGMRNLLAGRLSSPLTPADRGPLVENLVEILLRADPRTEGLHFWRTRGGAEVDFVWRVRGGDLYAVEVKASASARPTLSRSLSSFIKSYAPTRAGVIAPGAVGELRSGDTPVLFLPPERVSALAD